MADGVRKYKQTIRSDGKLKEKLSLKVDLLLLFPRIAHLAYDCLPSQSIFYKSTFCGAVAKW